MALCRRALGGKRDRYAIARPNKVETDPIAVDGMEYIGAVIVADSGTEEVSPAHD